MHKPIAFKVRGGGNYSGTKGGAVKPNEKGGAGYLGYEDKTFTIATAPDQWICTTTNNLSPQPTTMNEPAQPAPVGKPLRYLSVCSGMEAASVAWHPLGWTPVAFSEIEAFPSAILKHHFSKPNYPYDVPNLGSLTEYQSWPLEPGAIDLLVGGTPCQSFSVAGLRKGLADPRGNLALVFLGLADKLKPKWIVWENVPGVLSSNGGRDFGSFVGALGQLGYGWAMRILDAQHFGVPQRRRRVFVVACLGDWRAPAEVLSLREGLRGYLEAGGKKRKGSAADAGSGVEAGIQRTVGTLCAAFNQGQNAQYEPHIAESEVMDSLVARGPHAVGQPLPITFQPGNLRREAGAEPSTTTTLKASAGDQTPHVAIIQASELRLSGKITEQTTSPTLLAQTKSGDNEPLAVHPVVPLDGMNLLSRLGECGEEHSMQNFQPGEPQFTLKKGGSQHGVLTPMAVRRLTPVECERLQGFPDNWSRIPWKGKPETECPDGPRYKACGNSMAVPCMFWIGKRIAEVEAQSE